MRRSLFPLFPGFSLRSTITRRVPRQVRSRGVSVGVRDPPAAGWHGGVFVVFDVVGRRRYAVYRANERGVRPSAHL